MYFTLELVRLKMLFSDPQLDGEQKLILVKKMSRIQFLLSTPFKIMFTVVYLFFNLLLFIPAILINYVANDSFMAYVYSMVVACVACAIMVIFLVVITILLFRLQLRENLFIRKGVIVSFVMISLGIGVGVLNTLLIIIIQYVDFNTGYTLYFCM